MNKALSILMSGVLLVVVGLIAMGQGVIDFDPSTYNPAIGEGVTFSLAPGCVTGVAHYEWDFNGDGVTDVTTQDPFVDHTYATAGYMEVTVKAVTAGGRVMARRKGILVGKAALIGIRHVERQSDGSIIVSITIISNGRLSGVGIEEALPIGWRVGATQSGGVYVKRAGSKLQILWLNQLAPGDTVTFSYQLYPSQGNGVPAFAGTISGYDKGKRVSTQICGDLTLPY